MQRNLRKVFAYHFSNGLWDVWPYTEVNQTVGVWLYRRPLRRHGQFAGEMMACYWRAG